MNNPQALANPFFLETGSPYRIPFERNGKYAVLMRAYDKAGNFAEKRATLTILSAFISFTENGLKIATVTLPFRLFGMILAVLLALFGFFTYKLFKNRNLGKTLKKEVAEAEKEIDDVRKLERKIQEMRSLEEEAKAQSERLTEKLKR